MKPIVFYNHFHNGDLHISREFIKDIINKTNASCEYHHHCPFEHLSDINVIQKRMDPPNNNYTNDQIVFEFNDRIYINTWYNPSFPGYKKYGCTLPALYDNFQTIYQYLNIPIEPLQFYIPSIDFSKFKIGFVDDFMSKNKQRKIYISNGGVASGQSINFDMDPIILQLSSAFPNYLFIISNKSALPVKDNIIYSENIIQNNSTADLCENAYISTFCDIIIGRCSGTFSFALIKDNLVSDTRQHWIGICNIDPRFGVESFFPKNKTFENISLSDLNVIYSKLQSSIQSNIMEIIDFTQEKIPTFMDFIVKNYNDLSFFYPHEMDSASLNDILLTKKQDQYKIVTYRNKIIGYGILRGWDDKYEIPSLGIMIDKDFRGTGVSKMLMSFLESAAKLQGSTKIRLVVHKDNTIAINTYTKLGYILENHNDHQLIGFKTL